MYNLKEIRDMRESEAEEYGGKVRKLKEEHFNGRERLEQLVKVKEQKDREDRDVNEDLERMK